MNLKSNEEVLSEFAKIATYTNEYGYVHNIPKSEEVKAFILSLRKADMEAVRGLIKEQFLEEDFTKIETGDYDTAPKVEEARKNKQYNDFGRDILQQLPD